MNVYLRSTSNRVIAVGKPASQDLIEKAPVKIIVKALKLLTLRVSKIFSSIELGLFRHSWFLLWPPIIFGLSIMAVTVGEELAEGEKIESNLPWAGSWIHDFIQELLGVMTVIVVLVYSLQQHTSKSASDVRFAIENLTEKSDTRVTTTVIVKFVNPRVGSSETSDTTESQKHRSQIEIPQTRHGATIKKPSEPEQPLTSSNSSFITAQELMLEARSQDGTSTAFSEGPAMIVDSFEKTEQDNGGTVFDPLFRQQLNTRRKTGVALGASSFTNHFGEYVSIQGELHVKAKNGCEFRLSKTSDLAGERWFLVGCDDPDQIDFTFKSRLPKASFDALH
ncbi:hypothetical protein TDB9533_04429 [Thalassocella blandensis]|nr:hypothetical protein TDB9533_04429 [Thalassocella blandensis]